VGNSVVVNKILKKKARKLGGQTRMVGSKMIHSAMLYGQKTTTPTPIKLGWILCNLKGVKFWLISSYMTDVKKGVLEG